MMRGPGVIARTLSRSANVTDSHGNQWQYHSRSDHHSKTACWAMLFDLLVHCQPLRDDVAKGAVGFGINLKMTDFTRNQQKNLDLVLCTPGTPGAVKRPLGNFVNLGEKYQVALDDAERATLANLPVCEEVPVGDVLIALEAKAVMTAHQRALPRLYDELNSSHTIVHGHNSTTIAAGMVMVNIAQRFSSPDLNRHDLNSFPRRTSTHQQPRDAKLAVEKAGTLPKRADTASAGFDALGIIVVDCDNLGTPVAIHSDPPAPKLGDAHHYEDCIRRMCSLYRSRFPLL